MAVDGLLRRARRAAHRRQQPRERGLCAVAERAGQLRAPRGERVERLDERRVRRAALLLVGGAAQRVEAELLGLGEHRLDEARLADPERARDEQRAAVAGRGTPQRGRAPRRARARALRRGACRSRAARTAGPRVSSRCSASVSSEGSAPSRDELVAQQAELARGGRPVAARHVPAHERAVGLLVGGVLAQHVLPAALGAQQREAALAQPRARARASTARRARRAAARRRRRSRRRARSARRRWSPRRPGRARPRRRAARPRRGRRARGARSSRPCAGSTRRHRRRAAARAPRAPRRAACDGRERARAASRDPRAPLRPRVGRDGPRVDEHFEASEQSDLELPHTSRPYPRREADPRRAGRPRNGVHPIPPRTHPFE